MYFDAIGTVDNVLCHKIYKMRFEQNDFMCGYN